MSDLSSFLGIDARNNASKIGQQQQALLQWQAEQAKQIGSIANPYQQGVLSQLYQNATDPDIYGASYQNPRNAAYTDATAPAYDNAIKQTFADYASRGLTGDSSGLAAQVGQTRRDEANSLASFRRNTMIQGQQEQQRNLQNLQGDLAGQQSLSLNGVSNAAGGLGGVAAMYNSQANDAIKNIEGIAQTAAAVGTGNPELAAAPSRSAIPMAGDVTGGAGVPIGDPSYTYQGGLSLPGSSGGDFGYDGRAADAGDNTLGTNQAGAPIPMAGGAGTGSGAYSVFGTARNVPAAGPYGRTRGY
jgi:hypothetical protein